jgi:hypothetical protein
MKRLLPPAFHNPLSVGGAALFLINLGIILFITIGRMILKRHAPHGDLVVFIILPFLALCGLVLVLVGIRRERRRVKEGGSVQRRFPVIDFNEPRSRNALYFFSAAFVVGSLFYAFAGYKAYEYAESNAFCNLCHVNRPEYIAHRFSPHAEIHCTDCHIGAGAQYAVKAKMNGTIEAYKYITDKYPRPLKTPIENLRPSQEICERCHGPKIQVDDFLVSRTHFLSDAQNTRWTINLFLRKGTGPVESGRAPRMHWHSSVAKEIRYAATDPKRTVIPWIRVKRLDGTERVYRSTEGKIAEKDLERVEKRLMDCTDCHNRAGHFFRPPGQSLSANLQWKVIDPALPEIKSVGVKVLDENYATKAAAAEGIRKAVLDFYKEKYPEVASSKKTAIEKAVTELQNIYGRNYDPAMKASWKSFPDNAGHLYAPGCFRCHDGKHVSNDGKVLSKDCNTCHLIFTHQAEPKEGRVILTLAANAHPVDVGEAYKEQNCSDCHAAGN